MEQTIWRSSKPVAATPARSDRGVGRTVMLLTLGFWLFNFTLLTLTNRMDGIADWEVRATARAIGVCAGIGFCYLIHLALDGLRNWSFGFRAAVAVLLSMLAGDSLSWVQSIVLALLRHAPIPSMSSLTGAGLFTIAYSVWFFLSWSAMYLAFSYSAEVREQERRWAELRDLAHATQLRALSYQVRPHFLFNTLNSIATLVLDRRTGDAHAMIGRLADFLRESLAIDPLACVRLRDEVALQKLYLEIEQVRFPDLEIRIAVPEELWGAQVPSMILQPIVENSIKYAVAGCDGPAVISVGASVAGKQLLLTVEDSGCPSPGTAAGSGIGLRNVRERLHEQFGDDQSFEAISLDPKGYRVRLTMPLKVSS
jgi:LytS/YehU family sensor histidine kinase